MTTRETFPIMLPNGWAGGRRGIPWAMIAMQEAQAIENHDQTLKRLADRGGLGTCEAVAVLEGRRWRSMPAEEASRRLEELVEQWEHRHAAKEISDLQAQLAAATERAERAEREQDREKAVRFEAEGATVRAEAERDEARAVAKVHAECCDDLKRERDTARRERDAMREALVYVRDYAKRCSGDDSRLDEIVDHCDIALAVSERIGGEDG